MNGHHCAPATWARRAARTRRQLRPRAGASVSGQGPSGSCGGSFQGVCRDPTYASTQRPQTLPLPPCMADPRGLQLHPPPAPRSPTYDLRLGEREHREQREEAAGVGHAGGGCELDGAPGWVACPDGRDRGAGSSRTSGGRASRISGGAGRGPCGVCHLRSLGEGSPGLASSSAPRCQVPQGPGQGIRGVIGVRAPEQDPIILQGTLQTPALSFWRPHLISSDPSPS